MDKQPEKKNEQFSVSLSQSNENSNVLHETLAAQTEKISQIVGEDIPQGTVSHTAPQKKQNFFSGISQKISGLLSQKKEKSEKIPSLDVQKNMIQIELEKEKNELLRQAKKLEQSRYFSADSLEQILYRVRYLQKLISELIYIAADKINSLYRKYVLRKE